MIISKNTTLKRIYDFECFSDVKDLLIFGGDYFKGDNLLMTLEELNKKKSYMGCK